MVNLRKEKLDDAFSDEDTMTTEQAKVLLDFIMEAQKDNGTPEIIYPAQDEGVQVGKPVPPNLRCMGVSAKAMRDQLHQEAVKTACMLHESEVNASKALPPM